MTEVLYFRADWCQPCQAFGPLLERVVKDYPNVRLRKLNIDTEEGLQEGMRRDVRSIPTLATEHTTMVGAKDEATLRAWLDRF